MPFTVITLRNVPPSLRGDLTKWMQEISTGVYVGNLSTRVRENIWKRVCDSAGTGEATISYSCRNEIGYTFETQNSDRTVIDCDGIPLVLIPENSGKQECNVLKSGFSAASHMHKAHMATRICPPSKKHTGSYIVLDIETTGLDLIHDAIIEIGAIKVNGENLLFFHELINPDRKVPDSIIKLTGITEDMLAGKKKIQQVLKSFCSFIEDLPLVGYNIDFDIQFLNAALELSGMARIRNRVIDLLKPVKKEQIFQPNYKLSTTLMSYGIPGTVPHRALEDAKLIYELSKKVKFF